MNYPDTGVGDSFMKYSGLHGLHALYKLMEEQEIYLDDIYP
jgi:hypothetical protein